MASMEAPKLAGGIDECVVIIAADQVRDYAGGELVFSIDHRDAENVRVESAGLYLSANCKGPTHSQSFDDGFIVVRRDTTSERICGLQILRYEPGPRSVPELMHEVLRKQDRFLLDAVTTIMMSWQPIASACAKRSLVERIKRQWMLAHVVGKLAKKASDEPIWKVVGQCAS